MDDPNEFANVSAVISKVDRTALLDAAQFANQLACFIIGKGQGGPGHEKFFLIRPRYINSVFCTFQNCLVYLARIK